MGTVLRICQCDAPCQRRFGEIKIPGSKAISVDNKPRFFDNGVTSLWWKVSRNMTVSPIDLFSCLMVLITFAGKVTNSMNLT
jgi:hypothetical protein